MKIISNTGPIIALAKVKKLACLKEVASDVVSSVAVYRELFAKIGEESKLIEAAIADFIEVVNIKEKAIDSKIKMATVSLDEGEKQTIKLASTFNEPIVLLLDDRAGRQVAKELEFSTIGSIGILLRLKEKGLIEKVGVVLEEMKSRGYWLSDTVIEVAKKLAVEDND
jgi:predicted nucleic acid-binding protein